MALSDEDLRTLIVLRLEAAEHSCNGTHLTCVAGQLRGLLAALTGETPIRSDDACAILAAAAIPFTRDGAEYEYDETWLAAHGLKTVEGSDRLCHDRFGSW